jgi:hypothetical protein
MEVAYEMKISKSNISTVDSILSELTSCKSSNDTETNSVFGKIRSAGTFLTWAAILATFGLLTHMSWSILNEDLPKIAWTAVVFMIVALGLVAHFEMKKK